jgi:hypothetical protein
MTITIIIIITIIMTITIKMTITITMIITITKIIKNMKLGGKKDEKDDRENDINLKKIIFIDKNV